MFPTLCSPFSSEENRPHHPKTFLPSCQSKTSAVLRLPSNLHLLAQEIHRMMTVWRCPRKFLVFKETFHSHALTALLHNVQKQYQDTALIIININNNQQSTINNQQPTINNQQQSTLNNNQQTAFPSRVEEACRHHEEWNHLAVTDFWAKLNQVLVTAGSDLYAREIQARISTPQDTLDARHDMTEAKLEVMKLPPRRTQTFLRTLSGETHLHRMEDLLDILESDGNGT